MNKKVYVVYFNDAWGENHWVIGVADNIRKCIDLIREDAKSHYSCSYDIEKWFLNTNEFIYIGEYFLEGYYAGDR